MTNRPAIPPPPPRDTLPTPPPEECDDLPSDGEPASGTRAIVDTARLRAEWDAADMDPMACYWLTPPSGHRFLATGRWIRRYAARNGHLPWAEAPSHQPWTVAPATVEESARYLAAVVAREPADPWALDYALDAEAGQ